MRALIGAWLFAGLWLSGGALAAESPILDAASVPSLGDTGRAAYEAFTLANLPRAFALPAEGTSGAFGWAAADTLTDAQTQAIQHCGEKGGVGCAIYAENLDVVWPGRVWRAAAVPGPLISTGNYSAVPDARYLWWGPKAAAGVYVWSHGKGPHADTDNRGQQPQPHVRWFNNAGYDVVRFDRYPTADERERAAGWLVDVLTEMRRLGYRRVIAGGQSRGGWSSLQMLTTPGLADAIIAISPAAHGTGGSLNLTAQSDDLRQLFASAPAQKTRVAFVQFEGDPFIGDADKRRTLASDMLRLKIGSLLLIDRPPSFSGHGGARALAFSQSFGRCLFQFATAPQPPASC